MNAPQTNFLPKSYPISETNLKDRTSDIIGRIQREQGLNDRQLAEMVFCKTDTITNARNRDTKLSAHTLFNLLLVSPTALEGLLHHFDRRSVPLGAKCDTDVLTSVTGALHQLAVAAQHGGANDTDCLKMETALDAAIEGLCSMKSRCLSIREQRL